MIFAIGPKTCQDPKIYRFKDYSLGLDIFLIFWAMVLVYQMSSASEPL